MACGSCGKRSQARKIAASVNKNDLMGGYKYLTQKQINIRLEVYKKRFCAACNDKSKCDYSLYLKCTKKDEQL